MDQVRHIEETPITEKLKKQNTIHVEVDQEVEPVKQSEKEQELARLNAQLEVISKKASNLVKFNKKGGRQTKKQPVLVEAPEAETPRGTILAPSDV